jgi:hypothetical protein
MTPLQEALEALDTMGEIFNSSLYDAEIRKWRKIVEPVYVKVDDWKWCHRHNGPIELVGRRCLTWDTDDPGPCGRSPLYVEALDP